MLLTAEANGGWVAEIVLGPVFSSHVWSISWDAIVWPKMSPVLGAVRCMIGGKKPSMLEK